MHHGLVPGRMVVLERMMLSPIIHMMVITINTTFMIQNVSLQSCMSKIVGINKIRLPP
jgi:hypothetical protein